MMRFMNRPVHSVLSACAITLSISTKVFAWGSDGHSLINKAASQLAKSPDAPFFQANVDQLGHLALVPDIRWKVPKTYDAEKSMHFFQWDKYQTSAIASLLPLDLSAATKLLGAPYIAENGSSPWRAAQIYGMLIES
ncbi:MAG: hypothetical protein NTV32_10840, partial [Gammaproteobacteria bacterium]|nr:hypothetical protein [Gammaproteobacteria bacterium]